MNKRIFAIVMVACLCMTLLLFAASVMKNTTHGTKENPHYIDSLEDLCAFRDAVNAGNTFEGEYILQTENIDLSTIDNWIPIGPFGSEYVFQGCYDGGGHVISNLQVVGSENNGFFGQLGGKVINLGLEGGSVTGVCSGAISSHSASDQAVIANCYSTVSVAGARTGGLVDNFNGTVINCWSNPQEAMGGISGYSTMASIHNASTIALYSEGSKAIWRDCIQITPKDIQTERFVQWLNDGIYYTSVAMNLDPDDFVTWELGENGVKYGQTADNSMFNGTFIRLFLSYWGILIGVVCISAGLLTVQFWPIKDKQKV